MAKQGKVLPARRPRGEESLLIRSAESLGRVIGTLQRQLEKVDLRPPSKARSNGGARRAKPASARTSKRAAKSAAKKR